MRATLPLHTPVEPSVRRCAHLADSGSVVSRTPRRCGTLRIPAKWRGSARHGPKRTSSELGYGPRVGRHTASRHAGARSYASSSFHAPAGSLDGFDDQSNERKEMIKRFSAVTPS